MPEEFNRAKEIQKAIIIFGILAILIIIVMTF